MFWQVLTDSSAIVWVVVNMRCFSGLLSPIPPTKRLPNFIVGNYFSPTMCSLGEGECNRSWFLSSLVRDTDMQFKLGQLIFLFWELWQGQENVEWQPFRWQRPDRRIISSFCWPDSARPLIQAGSYPFRELPHQQIICVCKVVNVLPTCIQNPLTNPICTRSLHQKLCIFFASCWVKGSNPVISISPNILEQFTSHSAYFQ